MCEVPNRSWQLTLSPRRVGLGLFGLALIIAGDVWPQDPPNSVPPGLEVFALGIYSLGLILIGTAVLLSTVIFPTVKEVEFGFPSEATMTTAVARREEALRQEFDLQRRDLQLCAQLLCDDPLLARELVEASWATATATWPGPVTEQIRTYVFCALVELVSSEQRWGTAMIQPDGGGMLLFALNPNERTAVVLHDIAGFSSSQISTITNRSVELVRADLLSGTAKAEEQGTTQ